jgi:hypothetical protein
MCPTSFGTCLRRRFVRPPPAERRELWRLPLSGLAALEGRNKGSTVEFSNRGTRTDGRE